MIRMFLLAKKAPTDVGAFVYLSKVFQREVWKTILFRLVLLGKLHLRTILLVRVLTHTTSV